MEIFHDGTTVVSVVQTGCENRPTPIHWVEMTYHSRKKNFNFLDLCPPPPPLPKTSPTNSNVAFP